MLFPRTCPACGQVLADTEELCPECVQHIQRTEQALNRDNSTEDIFAGLPHFVYGGCWAFYVKQTYFQLLMHKAKFGMGNPELLRYLGRIAAREWEDTGFFDGIDYIVPIPLHWRRLRERGFNQSEYICKGMSDVLNIPIDTTHLTRDRYNKKQSQSSFQERQSAVRGIFSLNHPEEWYGKTIMIVDDILTTGSTLKAAIDTMKEVYNSRIVVFALAKTK